jgi:O-antigen/teichoic acid export membrane protein
MEIRRIMSFGGWMWLNATATAAYGTVDRILVARILGPAAAAAFYIFVQLAQLVHYIPSSVLSFSFPVFSRLSAGGDESVPAMRNMYVRLVLSAIGIAIVIGLAILVFQHRVLASFGGTKIAQYDSSSLPLLIVGFMILSLNVIPYYLLLGLGKFKMVAVVTSGSIVISLGLAVFFIRQFGLEGAAMARLAYGIGTLILLVRASGELRLRALVHP